MTDFNREKEELEQQIHELRVRLEVAEETLRAIGEGEVDAIVITGTQGEQIFTLTSADSSYRLLVEEMKEGAATLTEDGMILYCNRRLASLLKKPLEQLIGCYLKEFICSPDRSILEALLEQSKFGFSKGELALVTQDGTEVPVYLSVSLLQMENLQIRCIVVTDLSEQKRSQAMVADERLARSILDQVAEAIVVCDENGKIIRASRTAHDLCGKNPLFQFFDIAFPIHLYKFRKDSELDSALKNICAINAPETDRIKSTEKFAITNILKGENFQGIECFLDRTDGKKINLILSASPLLSSDTHLTGCVVTLTDITQRKQAEEALQDSEERLRLALEAAQMGTWEWNFLTDRFTWSNQAKKLLGLPVDIEEANYETFNNCVHPEDREFIQKAINLCIQKCQEYKEEYRVIWPDGSIHWMESRGKLLYNATGTPVRMLGMVMEISDRKATQLALQTANEQLEIKVAQRTADLELLNQALKQELAERDRIHKQLQNQAELLDLAQDAIITLDLQNTVTFWNHGAEIMYGWTQQEALGKSSHLLLQTELPKPLPLIENQLFQEGFWQGELNHRKRDGTKIIVASRWTLKRDTDGTPVGILEINNDITERKKADSALQESEARFRAATGGSLDAFLILQSLRDKTGHIIDFTFVDLNTKAEELLSVYKEDVIGKRLCELIPQIRTDGLFDKFVRVVKTGQVWEQETELAIPEIKAQWVHLQVIPLSDGIAVTCGDITSRKQAEEAVQRVNEQLTGWVTELEERNRETKLLAEMSEMLQACLSVAEAYKVISELIQPFFPDISGAIFVINSSKNLVETFATWGEWSATSESVFTSQDCWALRRGRSHLVAAHSSLLCNHIQTKLDSQQKLAVKKQPRAQFLSIQQKEKKKRSPKCLSPIPAEYLCVPMIAQGDPLGLLYLNAQKKEQLSSAKQRLATAVAEQIALALANLKLREALRQQSIRDSLTGLYNRRYLEESLEREINRSERKQHPLAVIMMDIDHFKQFNDNFGHEAGDLILQQLGKFLLQQVRGSDIACRYGGEELTLILPETSLEVAQERAEEIRQGVKNLKLLYRQQELGNITLSLGVATFPHHGATGEAVIRAADVALYQAKQQGRDRVIVCGS